MAAKGYGSADAPRSGSVRSLFQPYRPSRWPRRILADVLLMAVAAYAGVLVVTHARINATASRLVAQLTGLSVDELVAIGLLVVLLSLVFTIRRLQELRLDAAERLQLAEQLTFESMLLDSASDVVLVYDAEDGRVLYANNAACTARGLEREKLLSLTLEDSVGPGTGRMLRERFDALRDDKPFSRFEAVIEMIDGRSVHAEVAARRLYWGGRTLVVSLSRDITERKRSEAALAASRDFYLTLFEEFPALIWRAGCDGCRDYFNGAWLRYTGRELAQERGDGWTASIHPEDCEPYLERTAAAIDGRCQCESMMRLRRADGEYRWLTEIASPFFGLDGEFLGFIGACYDVTESKERADRLAYLAEHDELTGLLNRRRLDDALGRALARAKRGVPAALLFIDVDNFKNVNDTLGHQAGDAVLVQVAKLLERVVREEDLVVRLGGDEFAVLLEMVTPEEARRTAERLCDSVRRELAASSLTLSVGITVLKDALDTVELIRRADTAMYEAKQAGGDRIICGRG